jgi:hypothetical protein
MSRKTNRDHAKRQQRPMMEDKAIVEQLDNLLSEAVSPRASAAASRLRENIVVSWVCEIEY